MVVLNHSGYVHKTMFIFLRTLILMINDLLDFFVDILLIYLFIALLSFFIMINLKMRLRDFILFFTLFILY